MEDPTANTGRAQLDTAPIGVSIGVPSAAQPRVLSPLAATTSDGVALHGIRIAAPGAVSGPAIVVCHGFTHHTGHSTTRQVLAAFARHSDVVAFDMRGHGRSGGRNTVGDREILDVDAAVGAARALGHSGVATVGFSLGGAVVLRQAALGAQRPDAVVAVSAPARWYSRETRPMRLVHWLLEQPHGRLAAMAIGVRLDREWETVPPSPVEAVAAIAPIPLLLVHFAGDRYFTAAHATALAAASGGHADLRTWQRAGHGESGTDGEVAAGIADWALAAVNHAAEPLVQ